MPLRPSRPSGCSGHAAQRTGFDVDPGGWSNDSRLPVTAVMTTSRKRSVGQGGDTQGGGEPVQGVDQAVGVGDIVLAAQAKTHSGQPSGGEMTCTFPPWCLCLPDHHKSAPLGPAVTDRARGRRAPSALRAGSGGRSAPRCRYCGRVGPSGCRRRTSLNFQQMGQPGEFGVAPLEEGVELHGGGLVDHSALGRPLLAAAAAPARGAGVRHVRPKCTQDESRRRSNFRTGLRTPYGGPNSPIP